MNRWPSSNDYTIAIQSPQLCFKDRDLRSATVQRTRTTRMPKVWTGNFAQVYELSSSTHRWAVKCFTRSALDVRARYSKIAEAIGRCGLPYFVEFTFLDDEMLVNGARHAVVKMQWIEGQALDTFIEAHLQQPSTLRDTSQQLRTLVRDLEAHRLAHGDLQHGNIVMTATGIKLVDYDGLFVPAFAGHHAPETGLPSYQHPRRSASDYGVGLDRFALLVISTGLLSLAVQPSLWNEFSTGDNLLFTGGDFLDPRSSRLFQRLTALGDPVLQRQVDLLAAACALNPMAVPLLDDGSASATAPVKVAWWKDERPRVTARVSTRALDALRRARHSGWIAVALLAVAVASVARAFGTSQAVILALGVSVAAAIERIITYYQLPSRRQRRTLQTLIAQLRASRDADQRSKDDALNRLSISSDLEAAEKGAALLEAQQSHLRERLSAIPISQLETTAGISADTVRKLREAGIRDAYGLSRQGVAIQGIGPKRRARIGAQLEVWEREAAVDIPQVLPDDLEGAITLANEERRTALAQLVGTLTERSATSALELEHAEAELSRLRVPTLAEHLREMF